MARSRSGVDYGELFEKVTGETEVRERQAEDAHGGKTIEEDVAEYLTEHARDNGLDEALAEPDTE